MVFNHYTTAFLNSNSDLSIRGTKPFFIQGIISSVFLELENRYGYFFPQSAALGECNAIRLTLVKGSHDFHLAFPLVFCVIHQRGGIKQNSIDTTH
jgi:hypothetical protein